MFGVLKNRLIETVILSTHNICFGLEIRKPFFCYALLTLDLPDYYTYSDSLTMHAQLYSGARCYIEPSSISTRCVCEQRMLWRDCVDANTRLRHWLLVDAFSSGKISIAGLKISISFTSAGDIR